MNTFSRFKQAELVTAAGYIETSFTQDRAALVAEYIRFSQDYLTQYSAIYSQAKSLVGRKVKLADQKETTAALHSRTKALKPSLKKIENYINFARLNHNEMHNIAFPFNEIRNAIKSHDIEGLVENLNLLHNLLLNYKIPLEQEGLTEVKVTELFGEINGIFDLNQTQNIKMNATNITTQANNEVYKKLSEMMTEISMAGKSEFKTNPTKYKEYNPADLLKRVRQENNTKIQNQNNPE